MKCSTCEIGYRKQVTKQIRLNVKQHDNREYDLVQDICKHYHCTDDQVFKQAGHARNLYIYAMVHLLGRKQADVATILKMQESNVSRDLKQWFERYRGKKIDNIFPFLRKY